MLSLSLFSSVSCIAMVLLHESNAVFSNSLSGSVAAIFEDLCLMELLGNFGVRMLVASVVLLEKGS